MVWQLILRDVVQRAAKQALSEHVARATENAAAAAAAPPEPCHVGFVFALEIEAGGLEDLIVDAQHTRGEGLKMVAGQLAGRRVVIIKSGVGQTAAARGAATLIAGHRPQWLISAGLAGGLHPDIRRGDLLFANAILGADGARIALGESAVVAASATGAGPDQAQAAGRRVHVGPLLTMDRLIRLPSEKLDLGRQHQALGVDMESFAVAATCAQARTNFLSVRIISDAVTDELPSDIERLLDQKSSARRVGAALGAILNRPGSLGDMLKLKEQALTASDELARVLQRLVAELPE